MVNLIRDVCDHKITVGKWKNYVAHIMKEEKTFHEIDYILDILFLAFLDLVKTLSQR